MPESIEKEILKEFEKLRRDKSFIMAVVVQKMIQSEVSGVCFTKAGLKNKTMAKINKSTTKYIKIISHHSLFYLEKIKSKD